MATELHRWFVSRVSGCDTAVDEHPQQRGEGEADEEGDEGAVAAGLRARGEDESEHTGTGHATESSERSKKYPPPNWSGSTAAHCTGAVSPVVEAKIEPAPERRR